MLLFAPGDYDQSLALSSGTIGSEDLTFDYAVDDDYTTLNLIQAVVRDATTEALIDSHTLDLNQRIGFDATDVDLLDTQDTTLPFIEPLNGPFTSISWSTQIVVPDEWLSDYYEQGYELVLTATDIWGAEVSAITPLTAVPEPSHTALGASLGALGWLAGRRRRSA